MTGEFSGSRSRSDVGLYSRALPAKDATIYNPAIRATVVSVTGGTVVRVLPALGDPAVSADWVEYTEAYVGLDLPWEIQAVGTATTATLRSVEARKNDFS